MSLICLSVRKSIFRNYNYIYPSFMVEWMLVEYSMIIKMNRNCFINKVMLTYVKKKLKCDRKSVPSQPHLNIQRKVAYLN